MMHMAAVRYVTDWLRADVGGGVLRVNAELPTVPRFPGDGQPPDIMLITDIYRVGDLASQRAAQASEWPAKFPAIYVTPSGLVPMEGEIAVDERDAMLTVAISIIQRMADYAAAAQQASYYTKAVQRALVGFFADDDTGRTARGYSHASGIAVLACVGDPKTINWNRDGAMVVGAWDEKIGDNITEQPLFLNLHVRDTLAIGVAPAVVASVDVSPSAPTLAVGGTQQMTATPKDADGNVLTGRAVLWLSGNPDVATVSATGLVTAVGNGGADIVALVEGITGSAVVTVGAALVVYGGGALFGGG